MILFVHSFTFPVENVSLRSQDRFSWRQLGGEGWQGLTGEWKQVGSGLFLFALDWIFKIQFILKGRSMKIILTDSEADDRNFIWIFVFRHNLLTDRLSEYGL